MNPFRILLAAIRVLLVLIVMALFLFPYLILSSLVFKHTQRKAFALRRLYLLVFNFLMGVSVDRKGQIYSGPALYVCNHRSFIDPFILLQRLDAFVIAKAEVGNMPMINTGAKLTGIIYVQRDNKGSRTEVRQAMIRTIKSGLNVLVYPEGTTNPNKELMEYRPGSFLGVVRNDIPVVPVVLEYRRAKDIWFNRSLLSQFFRQFGHLRTECKLVIGPAFRDDEGISLRDRIQKWSQEQINEIHRNWDSFFSTQNLVK